MPPINEGGNQRGGSDSLNPGFIEEMPCGEIMDARQTGGPYEEKNDNQTHHDEP